MSSPRSNSNTSGVMGDAVRAHHNTGEIADVIVVAHCRVRWTAAVPFRKMI